MGGSSYDRDVYSSSSYSSWGTSSISSAKLSSSSLDDSMNPKGKRIKGNSKNPIVIVLDVTGSNIDFARLVYDKAPMFYGQIEEKKYLEDFEISVCAVGDASCDYYPLQIADFSKGIEIDSWLEKLVLESGGGGQYMESYELAAYYLSQNFDFDNNANPLIFFVGDEAPYPHVKKLEAEQIGLSLNQTEPINGFDQLRQKVGDNIFLFLNKYCGDRFDKRIIDAWKKVLPSEHLIKIKEEKSIVDLMLGTIALYGKNSLKKYTLDMLSRGQSQQRISGVQESLESLSKSLVPVEQFNTILPSNDLGARKLTPGKRL